MDTPKYTFSQEEIEQIAKYRDKQPDIKLKIRYIALLMIAKNDEINTVANVVGYSDQTIESWFSQYISKGLDSMDSFQYKPKNPILPQNKLVSL